MDNYDLYLSELRRLVAEKKNQYRPGSDVKFRQSDIAIAVGVSPGHLTGVLSNSDSRKASESLQSELASYFGTTTWEMISAAKQREGIGGDEVYSEGEQSFTGRSPDKASLMTAGFIGDVRSRAENTLGYIDRFVSSLVEDRNVLSEKVERLERGTIDESRLCCRVKVMGEMLSDAGVGIFYSGTDRNPVWVNSCVRTILGLPDDNELPSLSYLQATILDLADDNGKDDYVEFMQMSENPEHPIQMEISFKDGRVLRIDRRPAFKDGEFIGPVSLMRVIPPQ